MVETWYVYKKGSNSPHSVQFSLHTVPQVSEIIIMPRKLLLQMHMSLDGFIAGPNNSLMDWITFDFSQDMNEHIESVTASVDHMILGRNLAEGFIPAWQSRQSGEPGVDNMNKTPKVVFSTTLDQNPWGDGVSIVRSNFEEEVRKMKAAEGGDLITYGGVQTAQFLIEKGLVDEMFLLIDPVALGDGARLFTRRSDWEVEGVHRFECGLVMLHYRQKA